MQDVEGLCRKCQQRPATAIWCPDGLLAYTHGMGAPWCRLCVVREQLKTCRQMAARIPALEQEERDLS